MAPARKTPKALQLGEETLGQKLHRAYRLGRAQHGLTYREAAARISEFEATTEQMLRRLELDLVDMPTRKRQQRIVYLALITYGFDPADFGFDEASVSMNPQVMAIARRTLTPTSGCTSRTETAHEPRVSRVPAGRRGAGASVDRRSRSVAA